jgi:hypothetical protein
VDAVVFGRVTDLAAPRSRVVHDRVVSDRREPVYARRPARVRRADGSWVAVTHVYVAGYRDVRRVRRGDYAVHFDGRLGVNARMVDARDGSILWSGSDEAESDSFEDAADAVATAILKAVAARR